MPLKKQFESFQDASLLRKFSIFYFLISILPVSVLYYLYIQLHNQGRIVITEESFNLTLIFVVLGVGVGYYAMRSIMVNIINITRESQKTVSKLVGTGRADPLGGISKNEITLLAQSFNEITAKLEENVRSLEIAQKTLHSVLSRVGEGLASMENIDSFLNLIIETVSEAFQSETGALVLVDETKPEKDLYIKTVFGPDDVSLPVHLDTHQRFLKQVMEGKQPAVLDRIEGAASDPFFKPPLLCAPLVLHDEVLGIIVLSRRKEGREYGQEEKNLLYNLALQTAVAIENSNLNADAEKTYFETISALALAVEAKDPYSRGHLDRVARLVVQMGKYMNLSESDLSTLRDAAKLHDLGKIGILDKILTKPGPLTDEEMIMMKKHCEIGEGIIKPIRSLQRLCDPVRHHHEKLDGTGYPDGLKGDQIKPLVRILSVADIYDALTSGRPYRKAFTPERAIEVLRSMKDQIDQKIVDVLVSVLK